MPKTTTTTKTTKPRAPRAKKAPAPKVALPPNPFQSEILDLVSKARTRAKKIELLKEYRNDALVSLLIWNFDDSVVSMLPEGTVPYKPNEAPKGTEHTSLRSEQRSFYNFVKGGNDKLSKTRRETIFIQMLEGLHPEEADLLVLVKDKALINRYNVNRGHVEEAYPDIQWGGRG
ncbi:MAG: DUF6433 family protein [Candidatus Poseidoniales archaeon]|jgi:hypothetical protein